MSRAGFSKAQIYRALEQYRQDALESPNPLWPVRTKEMVQNICEGVVGSYEVLADLKAKHLARFNTLVASVDREVEVLYDAGRLKSGHGVEPSGYAPGKYSVAFTSEGLIKPIRRVDFRSGPLPKSLAEVQSSQLVLLVSERGTGHLALEGRTSPDPGSRRKVPRQQFRLKVTAVARYLFWRFRRSRRCQVTWDQLIRTVDLEKNNQDARKEAGRLVRELNLHLKAVGAPTFDYVCKPSISLPKGFPEIARPLNARL